jgi:glycosyltransferase involved in cell wall biosynthesis
MTDVSYVVTVYNKAWALPRVWESLRAQEGDFSREFVFVDDASTDNSVEVLRSLGALDDRVVIIENTENAGPAIRLNQGAKAASGRWLHMLDGDDAIPPNASQWMMTALEDRNAPLLYGCRRLEDIAPVPDDAEAQLIAEPLSFAAAKPITHIALMVARAVFMASGGCDERIFIQDQSLPLRLGARIQTMLWTDATLACQPSERPGELSKNVKQQHHDRFFSAYNVLNSLPEDHESTDALRRLCTSARWKSRRDAGGLPWFSAAFIAYLRSRTGHVPSDDALSKTADYFRAMDGIRRPG